MGSEMRAITDDEFPTWSDSLDVGFYRPEKRDGGVSRKQLWEDELASGRVFAGLEDGRAVGTLGAFSTDLTVPGGAAARVGAISAVTVLPTHLRRGILSGMMAQSLRQSAELGECASILIPAEWPIYGRFGYGPASEQVNTRIDAVEARLINP